MSFAKDFVWGASTSAYQIEGAWAEDGRGPSIWDIYSQEAGHTAGNHTGDTACDHYHHFREDAALMREIGLKAYRFSISWPRLLPEGTGKVNEAGVRFYSDLIDALLENGIEPYVTLFHWDLIFVDYGTQKRILKDSARWYRDIIRTNGEAFRHYNHDVWRTMCEYYL